MKKIVFAFIILIGVFVRTSGQTNNSLETSYTENSIEKLRTYLNNWANEIKPISDKELRDQKEYVKAAYGIFEVLFDPHNIGRLGVKQFRYDVYRNYHYFIIPQKVGIYTTGKVYFNEEETDAYTIEAVKKYVVPDSLKPIFIDRIKNRYNYHQQIIDSYGPYGHMYKDSTWAIIDSIVNFRPRVVQIAGVPLYLTKKYEMELVNFLGNTHVPFATGGVQNISKATGESAKRQAFLQNLIKIAHGHWGGYWELKTPPSIHTITFDKDFKYAKVDFVLIYEGGSAFLKLEKGQWQFISAKRVWQE